MKKILLVHPEGNCCQNVNLYGIIEVLVKEGNKVDILSEKRKFKQYSPVGSSLILYKENYFHKAIKKLLTNFILTNRLSKFAVTLYLNKLSIHKAHYDIIIGIDSLGIIIANILAAGTKTLLGFISYEIFFKSEYGKRKKNVEQFACRNIIIAVSQDRIRSEQLSIENNIPIDIIVQIPVAGKKIKISKKSNYLHEKLLIPKYKKIALYMGSCAKWTMYDDILISTNKWPDDWVLVVNSRTKLQANQLNEKNVYYTQEPSETFEELGLIISSADVGIALYEQQKNNPYFGKNLEYLGLSSGKISSYLQFGLPVISNEIGLMSNYIREYSLGGVLSNINELPLVLNTIDKKKIEKNCKLFFDEYLDLENNIDLLLNFINDTNS